MHLGSTLFAYGLLLGIGTLELLDARRSLQVFQPNWIDTLKKDILCKSPWADGMCLL